MKGDGVTAASTSAGGERVHAAHSHLLGEICRLGRQQGGSALVAMATRISYYADSIIERREDEIDPIAAFVDLVLCVAEEMEGAEVAPAVQQQEVTPRG